MGLKSWSWAIKRAKTSKNALYVTTACPSEGYRKGHRQNATGRQVPSARHLLDRHRRRLSGYRGRGTWAGPDNRSIHVRDVPPPHTDYLCGHRRRGSGGALGIGVGDRIAMLQYAYYSVISPEGCAGILWKVLPSKSRQPRPSNSPPKTSYASD